MATLLVGVFAGPQVGLRHSVLARMLDALGVPFLGADTVTLLQALTQWLLIALVGLVLALVAIVGFVVAGLILALLRDPLVGFVAAICRFITWPLAAIARGALRARSALRGPMRRAFAGLHYTAPDRTDDETSSWQGWDVLGPLIYLMFLILLGLGDLYFMMLRLAALLSTPASAYSLPISLDTLSGILWVAMVATFASVLFDLHGATPVARPYHNASPRVRSRLLKFVWTALAFSFVAAGIFWLWGQMRINGSNVELLGWIFTVIFAILLNIAVFLSGWAALAAVGVLYALTLALTRVLLWLVYGALELLVRLVNGLARVVVALIDIPARVGRVVYNWATKFDWARNRFLFELPPFEAPDLPGIDVDDLLEPTSGDSSAQMKVPPMLSGRALQDTVIAGLGTVGERLLLDLVAGEAPKLGPSTVLAVGAVNDSLVPGDAQTTRLRMRNVSPQRRELRGASDGKSTPDRARHQLFSDMIDRLIKVQSLARLARGQMLVLADLSALDEASASLLGDVERRMQGESVVLYALLPHRGQRDADLAEAFRRVLRLRQDGALAAAILVDPSGPFAASYGEQLLTQFAVGGLSGLYGAAAHSPDSLSVAQVMASVGQPTGLVGMAFGGRRLIPLTSQQSRPGVRGRAEFPEYRLPEMVAKAIEATEAALGEPSACGLESSQWDTDAIALVYTVPLQPQDPRWDEFAESVRAHAAKRGNVPSLLFVPGMGLTTDGVPGRDFGVQVTAFYPIPRAPKAMKPFVVEADHSQSRSSVQTDASATNPVVATVRGQRSTTVNGNSNGDSPRQAV